ncbi:MAG TPA: class I SAM-dependent methyltransferase [Acidimicrobiales bacterium]|nr:class I SAM-dependent methyltransferase [Acidimicrobiales bacterium]
MTDRQRTGLDVPLSELPPEEKAKRSGSFGEVASHYGRYRPGPSLAAVDWLLPEKVRRVVDLGAGTGALTRLLTDRADEVVAVEPDDRMRSVLTEEVPGIRAVSGRGESIPIPDGSADAVVASSSWHWMDPVATLHEVARVLEPGGVLGVVWSGPDPMGPFLVQARALLAERRHDGREAAGTADKAGHPGNELADLMGDGLRPSPSLEIPPDLPFGPPEHEVFVWDVALNADELIGLLGTFSWIITLPDQARRRVTAEARRLMRELLGIEGEATVDVAFRSDAWMARRQAEGPGPMSTN